MAREDDEGRNRDERLRRQVSRTIANWLAAIASIGLIAGWASTGVYQLEPGEAAVVLQLGKFNRSVTTPGIHWHLPPPLEYAETVNLTEIRREEFGLRGGEPLEPGEATATFENAIQTADSNIVNLSYVVQYRVADPFLFVYGMANSTGTLRDAAQAAVREVVGRMKVDEVLSIERARVQSESREILQTTLDGYFDHLGRSVFEVSSIELQIVQPPAPVQEAFDDVIAAQQDEVRATSEALGDAREIVERAGAEANEWREAAHAYKEARILESAGEAQRFLSLHAEYARAPEVTRRRLYLEMMEDVLPDVNKFIVESEGVNLLPYFPLLPGRDAKESR